ncbi:MAG: NAD(P)-dependent oxidoreductase [Betaproteobacteria bacterium]|nr:MAG: NAD(P)-dependent oxidoreductase [Betaproteobacteria bacterium]
MAEANEPIGFIGVGVMGGPMSERLLQAGYALIVHDVDPGAMRRATRAGAKPARSAKEVADRASTVFVSLPTPQVVREVALGARGVVRGSKVRTFVDLSTTGTAIEKEIAAAVAKRKIVPIDAPVSGGATGAKAGTLAVMVAGDRATIERLRPLFEVFGTVFVAGRRPGQAQMLKLLNNLLSLSALAMSCEAMVAGVKAGLDPDLMVAAINAGSGRNTATLDKIPRAILTRTFDFGFPISGALKDVGLAVDECQALGVPMWVGNAARQLWQYAYAQGEPKRDMTRLITYLEKLAGGVTVKGKAAKRVSRNAVKP